MMKLIEYLKYKNYLLRCKLQIALGESVENIELDSHILEDKDETDGI
jgi:hypothetical protein